MSRVELQWDVSRFPLVRLWIIFTPVGRFKTDKEMLVKLRKFLNSLKLTKEIFTETNHRVE